MKKIFTAFLLIIFCTSLVVNAAPGLANIAKEEEH
jgi:hypothetical protein